MNESDTTPTSPAAHLPRRDALKLIAAASVAVSAGGLLGAAGAQGTPAAPSTARFMRSKVGDYTVVVLSDGQSAPGNAFPNWGANPDLQDQFAATLRENFLDPARFINNYHPMLIDTGTERVLIDTGRGGNAGRLLENLRGAGYQPGDITTVFITHGHPDHIGGVTTNGALTFPRARLVMGEREFQHWASQASPSGAVQANVLALKDRYELVGENAQIVPGVTTVPSYGHTPGHMAVLVRSGNDELMHLGDAGGHYILSLQYPQHYLGFDADKAGAVATRARLFDRAASDRLRVVGYHFAYPGVGHVRRAGNAYEYVPDFFEF